MKVVTQESIGPSGLYALQVVARLGGSITIDLNESTQAQAAAVALITLTDDGCCTHTKVADAIAKFTLTDLGWRVVNDQQVH